jgi:hypothetical protein
MDIKNNQQVRKQALSDSSMRSSFGRIGPKGAHVFPVRFAMLRVIDATTLQRKSYS